MIMIVTKTKLKQRQKHQQEWESVQTLSSSPIVGSPLSTVTKETLSSIIVYPQTCMRVEMYTGSLVCLFSACFSQLSFHLRLPDSNFGPS